ncbi:hypothetical protein DIPPA_54917 [Diplonema papillatum]|nr:hypothetical protein DIPPA_54917 [Diplonema papillatum]
MPPTPYRPLPLNEREAWHPPPALGSRQQRPVQYYHLSPSPQRQRARPAAWGSPHSKEETSRLLKAAHFRHSDTLTAVLAGALAVARTAKRKQREKLGKATRRELGMRGMLIASSGVGHSVRTWWDEKVVRRLQLGAPGEKMPKHGGWNDKIIRYLDCPGFLTSMRCGIGLQNVWVVKFRDGLEIPLHRDCLYKSLYPQLRGYLYGLLHAKAAKAAPMGALLHSLPGSLAILIASFLFHSPQPSFTAYTARAFTTASKKNHTTIVVKGVKRGSFQVHAGQPIAASDVVDKKAFTQALGVSGVCRSFAEEMAKIVGDVGNVTWEDLVGSVKKVIDSRSALRPRRSIVSGLPGVTASCNTPAAVAGATQASTGVSTGVSGAKRESVLSVTSPPQGPTKRESLTTGAAPSVVVSPVTKPASTTTPTAASRASISGSTSSEKPPVGPAGQALSAAKPVGTSSTVDVSMRTPGAKAVATVVSRGEMSLPVASLRHECVRLSAKISELEGRAHNDVSAQTKMREMINTLQWQLDSSINNTPPATRRHSLFSAHKSPCQQLQLKVKCMTAKLSRRSIPAFLLHFGSTDTVYTVHQHLEMTLGIPKGRQIVAIEGTSRLKTRRLPEETNTTLSDAGVHDGNTLLVSESGPIIIDFRLSLERKVRLKVYPDETIGFIKDVLSQHANTSSRELSVFTTAGSELKPDSRSLWDCGLRCGVIMLDVRRTGRQLNVTAATDEEGRLRKLQIPIRLDETASSVKQRLASRLSVNKVQLHETGHHSIPAALPDSVSMNHVANRTFLVLPDKEAETASRLSKKLTEVRSLVDQLARNTGNLQDTIETVKGSDWGDRHTMTYDQPSVAMASTLDTTTDLLNRLSERRHHLDIVKWN